jgi:hypothetical protein
MSTGDVVFQLLEDARRPWEQEMILAAGFDPNALDDNCNICQFIYKSKIHCTSKLFFGVKNNTADVKPFHKDNQSWAHVFRQLHFACKGSSLVKNGSPSKVVPDGDECPLRKICCFRCTKYAASATGHSFDEYRPRTIFQDHSNNRNEGRSLARKCTTNRSTNDNDICNFHFFVGYDTHSGYYLVVGRGNNQHVGHPYDSGHQLVVKSNMIDEGTIQLFNQVSNAATGSTGINARIFFQQHNRIIPRTSVRYLNRFNVDGLNHGHHFQDPSSLFDYFQEHQIHSVTLLHNSSTGCFTNGANGEIDTSHCHFNYNELNAYLNLHREKDSTIADSIVLFAAVAWASKEEMDMFTKFPMVVMVDALAQTTNELRPLITIACRHVDGTNYPVLRAYLPNEAVRLRTEWF